MTADRENLDASSIEKAGSEEALEQQLRESTGIPTVKQVVETPLNLVDPREETRAQLARGLLLILAFVVAGLFVFIGFDAPNAAILTQAVLPAVIGLTGTALGFYFGAHGQSGTDGSGRTQR